MVTFAGYFSTVEADGELIQVEKYYKRHIWADLTAYLSII